VPEIVSYCVSTIKRSNRTGEKKPENLRTYSGIRTPDPAAQHINTRGIHIHPGAIVGKPRPRIRHIRRAHRAGSRLASRRIKLRVIITVSRGHSKEHPRPHSSSHSAINRIRPTTAETHIRHNPLGALPRGCPVAGVGRDEVDARDDRGNGARAAGVEHLDGEQLGLLGHAVGDAADGARDVRAVACAVAVGVVDEVGQPGRAALEFLGIRQYELGW
jgi:hypothetical protein